MSRSLSPTITLGNGRQTVSFAGVDGGYRPEWFRLDRRPMLRFKDHEFLNLGAIRVTRGELLEQADGRLRFGGEECFAGVREEWRISGAASGSVTPEAPLTNPIEVPSRRVTEIVFESRQSCPSRMPSTLSRTLSRT